MELPQGYMGLLLIVWLHIWCRGDVINLIVKWFAPITMDSRWYPIGVEPSVYQGFGHCFCLLISCYPCHSKIREGIHHNNDIFITIFIMVYFVKSKHSRSNGYWLLTILASHLDHYMDPWPSYPFYMIWPNWLHLGTLCCRKIFLVWEPTYVLFSAGTALHEAVVALGPYKLLVVPTGDIWLLNFINTMKYSLIGFLMIKLVEIHPHIFLFFFSNLWQFWLLPCLYPPHYLTDVRVSLPCFFHFEWRHLAQTFYHTGVQFQFLLGRFYFLYSV